MLILSNKNTLTYITTTFHAFSIRVCVESTRFTVGHCCYTLFADSCDKKLVIQKNIEAILEQGSYRLLGAVSAGNGKVMFRYLRNSTWIFGCSSSMKAKYLVSEVSFACPLHLPLHKKSDFREFILNKPCRVTWLPQYWPVCCDRDLSPLLSVS